MKTLIGVDTEKQYEEALGLLARLRFPNNEILMAHVQEPILSPLFAAPQMVYFGDAELTNSLREAGERILQEATEEAKMLKLGSIVTSAYAFGPKAGSLLDLATDREVDLLAIGSGRKGTLESFFMGSVGRSLAADCTQSFLVTRGSIRSKGPVHALFATDLSSYSDRCLDRFLAMAPEGIEEVTVVTAVENEGGDDLIRQFGYQGDETVTEEEVRRVSSAVGEGMAERLRTLGYRSTFVLEQGYAREALPAAMLRTGADLLILGAKGHKFIDRLLHGSVSYHEVTSEPYSVLVIRANGEEPN